MPTPKQVKAIRAYARQLLLDLLYEIDDIATEDWPDTLCLCRGSKRFMASISVQCLPVDVDWKTALMAHDKAMTAVENRLIAQQEEVCT